MADEPAQQGNPYIRTFAKDVAKYGGKDGASLPFSVPSPKPKEKEKEPEVPAPEAVAEPACAACSRTVAAPYLHERFRRPHRRTKGLDVHRAGRAIGRYVSCA